ncbi:MAG TPA: hypothetical protein VLE93_01845 [Candidatus Saccharimonadales bacterium]|nr:hypothetical protein [Candidatus Saccharimonadales bacterium]
MIDWQLISWPVKRWLRHTPQVSEAGWWLTVIISVTYVITCDVFYRLGFQQPSLLEITVGFFLVLGYALGLWLGYSRVLGQRPNQWRLVNRINWAYREMLPGLIIFLLVAGATLNSFLAGAQIAAGRSDGLIFVQNFGLLAAVAGTVIFGSSLSVIIKAISRSGVVRLATLALVIYASIQLATWLRLPLSALVNSLTAADSNQITLSVVGLIGWFGLTVAISELILPHWPINPKPARQFIATRLPTKGLGGFGPGTAIFSAEIIRFLRSSRLLRRFILAVAIVVAGLVTLNLFSHIYPQNAEQLFITLLALTIGWLMALIGQDSGWAAAERIQQYRMWPVGSRKILTAVFASGVAVAVIVSAVLIELFAAGAAPISQLFLLTEIALLVYGAAFVAGRAGHQLVKTTDDSWLGEIATGALALLVMIFGAIALFFFGIVVPSLTALVVAAWAGGVVLIFERLRRRNESNSR